MRFYNLVCLMFFNILISGCQFNNETVYSGILSRPCVLRYCRLFLNRKIPRRDYLYFHETLTDENYQKQLAGTPERRSGENAKFRIVGGKLISIMDAPYQVLYGLWCGGSLIAPEWVLTAAHCNEKENYVYAGSTYRSKGTKYRICAHFTHPGWSMKNKEHVQDWDYQLLLLETPVPVTAYSRPIAIGTEEDITRPGQQATITGWGHTHFKNSTMQELLHRVRVPLIPREQCLHSQFKSYHITARMFCAGLVEGSRDACQGDSGGPVVVNGRLVGSVSFGIGCAQAGKPGVSANVPMVRAWIRQITQLPL